MRVTYRRVLRIRVRHGWYADGESHEDFEVVPTASTVATLQRLALGTRFHPDGITVFAEVEPGSNPPTLVRPLGSEALCFAFELRPVKTNLLAVAELPRFSPGRTLFCFDNLQNDVSSGRKHLGDSVAAQRIGAPALLVTRDVYTHRFAVPVAAATLTLRDRFGTPVVTIEARSPSNDLMPEYRLDLATALSRAPGRYSIVDDYGTATDIYYDPDLDASRPVGVIEIFSSTESITPDASNRVPTGYRFVSGAALLGLDAYYLQFNALATTWRYNVTKKFANNGIALNQLTVAGSIAFAKNVSGDRATFTSATPVPLSQTSRGLKLKAGNQAIQDLPDPSVTALPSSGASPGVFVSDMFVFV